MRLDGYVGDEGVPIVDVPIAPIGGETQHAPCVVDTGSSCPILLSHETARRLALEPLEVRKCKTATSDELFVKVCLIEARIGRPTEVVEAILGHVDAIGTGLLAGHAIRIDLTLGGAVRVEPVA